MTGTLDPLGILPKKNPKPPGRFSEEGQSRESKISELTGKLNEPRLQFFFFFLGGGGGWGRGAEIP